jgi:hypothetical protein
VLLAFGQSNTMMALEGGVAKIYEIRNYIKHNFSEQKYSY